MRERVYLVVLFATLASCKMSAPKGSAESDAAAAAAERQSIGLPEDLPDAPELPEVQTPVVVTPTQTLPNNPGSTSASGSNRYAPSQLLNDFQLMTATSSGKTSYHVPDYWPTPAAGMVLINELAYTDGNGNAITYQIQRYANAGSHGYYLEDYLIDDTGKQNWNDTWVYKIDPTRGVLETIDTMAGGLSNQQSYPLLHGKTLHKKTPFVNTAYGTLETLTGEVTGSFWNNYFLQLEDIKTQVTLPGGTFSDVVMQSEQQIIESTTQGVTAPQETLRYRFYFAKNIGIIAIQWLEESWLPESKSLLYITKSCLVSDANFRCP